MGKVSNLESIVSFDSKEARNSIKSKWFCNLQAWNTNRVSYSFLQILHRVDRISEESRRWEAGRLLQTDYSFRTSQLYSNLPIWDGRLDLKGKRMNG